MKNTAKIFVYMIDPFATFSLSDGILKRLQRMLKDFMLEPRARSIVRIHLFHMTFRESTRKERDGIRRRQ